MIFENMILIPQQIKVVTNDFSYILPRGNSTGSFLTSKQSMMSEHLAPLLHLVWCPDCLFCHPCMEMRMPRELNSRSAV
jgi:hypothetical protein